MSASAVYVATAVGALAVLVVVLAVRWPGRGERRLTPLAGVALACVAVAVVFSEERVVGYAFMGLGIILAVVDMVRRRRGQGVSDTDRAGR